MNTTYDRTTGRKFRAGTRFLPAALAIALLSAPDESLAQPVDPAAITICYQAYRDSDYDNAISSCEPVARAGDANAAFIMASLLALEKFGVRDFTASVYWLERAADSGHVEAAYNLGVSYQNGHAVDQDYELAAKWYRLAADDGSAKAQRNLGALYEHGRGVERSDALAFFWFRQAAERELPDAQLKVGLMYLAGRGVAGSQREGFDWIERAANAGNIDAQLSLGLLLDSNGRGEGIPWYEGAAAEGNTIALHNLAVIYLRGEQVERDLDRAMAYAERSVALGNRESATLVQDIRAAMVEAAVGGFDDPSTAVETLAPELSVATKTRPDIVDEAPPPPDDQPGMAPVSLAPDIEQPIHGTPPVSGWLREPGWLQERKASEHTVQLVVASDLDAINRYVRRHRIGHHAHIIPSARGRGDQFVLVYGVYPDRAQARLAAQQLPSAIRDEQWVRSFGKLQEQHL